MTKTICLFEAAGRKVPQEDGSPWPKEGLAVERSLYIRRRIADGDLVETRPAAAAEAVPAETAPDTVSKKGQKAGTGEK